MMSFDMGTNCPPCVSPEPEWVGARRAVKFVKLEKVSYRRFADAAKLSPCRIPSITFTRRLTKIQSAVFLHAAAFFGEAPHRSKMLTLRTALFQLSRKPAFSPLQTSQLTGLIQEADEVLSTLTSPKDGLDRLGITAYDSVLTLPRRYATCEGAIQCCAPLVGSSRWVEFLLTGPGKIADASDAQLFGQFLDLGDGFCCFREPNTIDEDGCRLKVYTDAANSTENTETIIEFYGTDSDGEVIRTLLTSAPRTGEALQLLGATGYATTTSSFATISQVVKPVTVGILSVYAVDPDDSSETLIATYAPNETVPSYRRYRVPPACDGTDSYVLTALCRKRYTAPEIDDDPLSVDNFSALVSAILFIQYRDANEDDRAARQLKLTREIIGRQNAKFLPASQSATPVILFDEAENPTYQGF